MRICLISETAPPIGDSTARSVAGLADYLVKTNHNVLWVTPKRPGDAPALPCDVVEMPLLGRAAEREYPVARPGASRVITAIRDFEPDIVHAHTPYAAMTLARKINAPTVLSVHSAYDLSLERFVKSPVVRGQMRKMLEKNVWAADEIWVSSAAMAHRMAAWGYTGGHIVMPRATEFSAEPETNDEEKADEVRAKYNIPKNEPVLLIVSRMLWYKGMRQIVKELDALKVAGQKFHAVMVGDGADRAAIEDFCTARHIDGITHFAGNITDRAALRAYYDCADLLVLPSVHEGLPLTLLEAAARSLPAVAPAASAAAEYIGNDISGYIVAGGVEFAARVRDALSDRRKLKRVGASARADIYAKWESAGQAHINRYATLIRLQNAKKAEEEYLRINSKVLNKSIGS